MHDLGTALSQILVSWQQLVAFLMLWSTLPKPDCNDIYNGSNLNFAPEVFIDWTLIFKGQCTQEMFLLLAFCTLENTLMFQIMSFLLTYLSNMETSLIWLALHAFPFWPSLVDQIVAFVNFVPLRHFLPSPNKWNAKKPCLFVESTTIVNFSN